MITREEAIKGLKELRAWECLPFCIEEPLGEEGVGVITKEAIDLAIEALSQTSCGDCVSRQYLLGCVVDKDTMPYVPINKIQNAPSVRPELSIIDKIKEDIAEEVLPRDNPYTGDTEYSITHGEVLDIIDKYIAEMGEG